MATRLSGDQLARKQAELGLLKNRIDTWEELSSEKDCKLWKLIGPRIKTAKDAAEKDAIRMVVEGNDDKARLAAGQAIAYEHIFNEVENTSGNIEAARARVEEIRETLSTAKKHGGIID